VVVPLEATTLPRFNGHANPYRNQPAHSDSLESADSHTSTQASVVPASPTTLPTANRHADSHCDTLAHPNGDAHVDGDCVPYARSADGDGNAHANADAYADGHRVPYARSADGDTLAHPNGDAHARSYRHADTCPDGYANPDTSSHSHGDCDRDRYHCLRRQCFSEPL
jgi:hypothetical protein